MRSRVSMQPLSTDRPTTYTIRIDYAHKSRERSHTRTRTQTSRLMSNSSSNTSQSAFASALRDDRPGPPIPKFIRGMHA